MIGRTLGNYRIVEQIGIGGMATVFKAYDPDTDRYVAIKILPRQFSQDPTFRQRFQREAKAIAKLEHIHILPIFAYGEEDGIAYMVMRYLKAGTLTDRIRQGPLPLREASRLLNQIAGALDHAHAYGVLHRDVKPSNVLLDADGNAFLTDFGIAKMVESTLDLTAGGILGTPAYMSPEQCQGSRELTSASDIFSLGIILYEMVTGRTPFQAETPIALIHMQLNEPMPPPCQLRPDLPEDGQRVILKALARDPKARYQTCAAMAAAFGQAIARTITDTLQPAVAAPTVADKAASGPTSPAIEEATVFHKAAEKTAVVQASFWRRIPGWALGLVGLLLVAGLIAGAVAAGLLFTGQESASPGAIAGEAANKPTLPADEAQVEAEIAPTPPGPEATAIPPAPVSLGEPPAEGHEVLPCDWHGLGPGLCITPLQGDQPRKILTESELEITSAGSWSPDGQLIAFSAVEPGGRHDRDQSIRIVNSDGTGLTELPTENNDTQPVWSPDGQWLAFHSSGNLAVMHPDTSMLAVIYEPPGGCVVNPQWSPDSQSIVFNLIRNCEWNYPLMREVWIVTIDGKTAIPIASATDKTADCSRTEVAFSPDGDHVAYYDDQCRAWLARADGSGETEPLADFAYWWTGIVHPQWGKEFVSDRPPEPISTLKMEVYNCDETAPSQICVHNFETDQVIQITDNLEFGSLGRPTWSPDGRQLIFSAGSDPEVSGAYDRKLYTINADGSDQRQITYGEVNDVNPVWSPDGQWIAFHRNCGLWLIRPDGSEPQELVAGSEELCAIGIAWRPDSRVIVFWNVPGNKAINRTIWGINRDGTGRKVIYSFEQPVDDWGELAYSPDGQQIVFWYEAGGQGQGLLINADGRGEPEVIGSYEEMPWHWFPWNWPPG